MCGVPLEWCLEYGSRILPMVGEILDYRPSYRLASSAGQNYINFRTCDEIL